MSDCKHDRYKRGQGYCPDCGLYADDVESELVRFERDRLAAENERLREDWAMEFEKRGTEVASVERQKARLAIALMRLRDEGDQLCPTQIVHIAREALAGEGE